MPVMAKQALSVVYHCEVRFHGCSGQGSSSAASMLAFAARVDGYEAHVLHHNSVQQSGAPVAVSVYFGKKEASEVVPADTALTIVIQDSTLLQSEQVLQDFPQADLILLNSGWQSHMHAPQADEYHWLCVPAGRISESFLGESLPNTALLGALAAASGWVGPAALEKAIRHGLAGKGEDMIMANIKAMHAAYQFALEEGNKP